MRIAKYQWLVCTSSTSSVAIFGAISRSDVSVLMEYWDQLLPFWGTNLYYKVQQVMSFNLVEHFF